MDINKRKPRVINLRKKGLRVEKSPTPAKIHIDNPIVSEPTKRPWEGGTFPCIRCGAKEAIEFGRCRACDTEHREVVTRLDARPKQVIERILPKLTYRKEVSGGVVVTISSTEPLRLSK